MKLRAVVPLLIFSSFSCFAQTFMVVAVEIRDGEELSRPFASQEGMLEGLFDSGFVSFDTGLYKPAVDWRKMDFEEPMAIARQGLAQYLLAAEVRSITETRDPAEDQRGAEKSPAGEALRIETSAHYYLFDPRHAEPIGEGEILIDNEAPESRELTYTEFLHSVGRNIAARGIELMQKATTEL